MQLLPGLKEDFKETPSNWIPASGVTVVDDNPQPDEHGHTPGWVPVQVNSRDHLWHLSSIDEVTNTAFVLRQCDAETLELVSVSLESLCDSTLELIGTNVNGNPYKLGSKQQPLHLLVPHGSIQFSSPPPLEFDAMREWLDSSEDGAVEGAVWHCDSGALYKIHRHHFGLEWPIDNLRLNNMKVRINVDVQLIKSDNRHLEAVRKIAEHNGRTLDRMRDLNRLFIDI